MGKKKHGKKELDETSTDEDTEEENQNEDIEIRDSSDDEFDDFDIAGLSKKEKELMKKLKKIRATKRKKIGAVKKMKKIVKREAEKKLLKSQRKHVKHSSYQFIRKDKMRNADAWSLDYNLTPPREVNDLTVADLTQMTHTIIGNAKRRVNEFRHGNIYVKFYLGTLKEDKEDEESNLTVDDFNYMSSENFPMDVVNNRLFNIAMKHSNDENDPYVLWLIGMTIHIFNVNQDSGGCRNRLKKPKLVLSETETLKTIDTKSSNNNCLGNAIKYESGDKVRIHQIKTQNLGLAKDAKMNYHTHKGISTKSNL